MYMVTCQDQSKLIIMNALKCVTLAATYMIHSKANFSTNRKTIMIEVVTIVKQERARTQYSKQQSNTCVHCSMGVVTQLSHKAQTEIVATREQRL